MNFDFTDDQHAIKRTAKDFLAARFTADRLRELAEGGTYDDSVWKELCELGWPGIFVSEENGGQGLGTIELVILMEELGYALAPVPFLSTAAAGLALQTAGSDEQQERWLSGIANGELRGTVGLASNGEARLVPDAEGADVIVLLDRDGGRVVEASEAEIEPLHTIDATRRFAKVRAEGGDALPGDTSAVLDRIVTRAVRGAHGSEPARDGDGRGLRPRSQAVRAPDRRLPGGGPPLRADAAGDGGRPFRVLLRGVDGGRGARDVPGGGVDGQGLCVGCGVARHGIVTAGARRHRLHLGARPAFLPEAGEGRRAPLRVRGRAPRARGRAHRPGRRARPRDWPVLGRPQPGLAPPWRSYSPV